MVHGYAPALYHYAPVLSFNPPGAMIEFDEANIEQPWFFFYNGASNHITSNLSNLSLHSSYKGPIKVTIGNGDALPIHYTGSGKISIDLCDFKLSKVLHVPRVSTNLLSVNQLACDNECVISFDDENVFIQDKCTRILMFHGFSEGGMYPLSTSIVCKLPLVAPYTKSNVGSV